MPFPRKTGDAGAEEEKSEADAAKKKEADQKAFGQFAENASGISALVGQQPEEERVGFVRSLFEQFPGGPEALSDPSNTLTLANIFGAFNKVNSDDDSSQLEKDGSAAVLEFFKTLGE